MKDKKHINIEPLGSGMKHTVEIEPGDTPRQVLAQVLDMDPGETELRTGTNKRFENDADLFQQVNDDEVLVTASTPVVGRGS